MNDRKEAEWPATALPANSAKRWKVLPPTPAPIPREGSGHADANGVSIYLAVYGERPHVMRLHYRSAAQENVGEALGPCSLAAQNREVSFR